MVKKETDKTTCYKCSNIARTRCGKCKVAMYCSKICQVGHWNEHKKICKMIVSQELDVINYEDIKDKIEIDMMFFLSIIIDSIMAFHGSMFYKTRYYGYQYINNTKYRFLEVTNETMKVDVRDYFVHDTRTPCKMNVNEFQQFFLQSRGQLFSSVVALSFDYLTKKGAVIAYNKEHIKSTYICGLSVALEYTKCLNCFESEQNRLLKPPDKWQTNESAIDSSTVLILNTEEYSYLLDLTAAQYGILTKFDNGHYGHIERLQFASVPMLHDGLEYPCSYGRLFDITGLVPTPTQNERVIACCKAVEPELDELVLIAKQSKKFD